MNDFKLNQLLDDALRVEETPDLWMRISPRVSTGLSGAELLWAGGVAMAVLLVLVAMPLKAVSVESRWEPIAYKARMRAHQMAASHDKLLILAADNGE